MTLFSPRGAVAREFSCSEGVPPYLWHPFFVRQVHNTGALRIRQMILTTSRSVILPRLEILQ